MFHFVKKGAWMLLVASLAAGMVACDDDDPDYSNVQPPVVEVAASNLSGVITTMGGQPISGAAVKASTNGQTLSATTGADGTYRFDDLEKGTYDVEVAAEGKQTVQGQVTLAKDGESVVFNAILANAGQEVEVSATEDQTVTLVTETLPDNEEAEVETVVEIPAAAVDDEEAVIIVTPVYGEGMVTARAVENTLLVGMEVAANKPGVQLKKSLTLTFNVGADVAAVAQVKKTVDGQTAPVAARQEGDKLIVEADAFGVYALYLDFDIQSQTATEDIRFAQSEFDNLYGSKDLLVTNAAYTYKLGAEQQVNGEGALAAHLRQMLAVRVQAADLTTANGSYELNVTLPVGTALELEGTQEVTTITASVGNVSGTVKTYGKVSLSAKTYNRKHNGGSAGGL